MSLVPTIGAITAHHAKDINPLALDIINPQSGVGGLTPNPKKDNELNPRSIQDHLIAPSTKIASLTFGNISFQIIERLLWPLAFAGNNKVFCYYIVSSRLLQHEQFLFHKKTLRAGINTSVVVPRSETIKSIANIQGIDKNASTILITISSILPPTKPQKIPRRPPHSRAIIDPKKVMVKAVPSS
jgi:hypothetical protein